MNGTGPVTATAARPETGIIARFTQERGFGFIKPDSGGPDVFLHISEVINGHDRQRCPVCSKLIDTRRGASAACPGIRSHISPGDRVEFSRVTNDRGVKAVSVKYLRVPDAEPAWQVLDEEAYRREVRAELVTVFPVSATPLTEAAVDKLVVLGRRHGWVGH
jgi:cold shock CspA family protein